MGRFIRGAAKAALTLCCLVTPAAGAPALAQATQTHPVVSSFGSFSAPGSVAVDESSGDVYVLDAGASSVQRFDSAGNPVNFTAGAGAGTNALSGFAFDGAAASQIAIDNSGSATAGDVYVASTAGVDVYAPDGSHLGRLTQAGGVPYAVEACGVAVDPSGAVYVAEYGGNIDRYIPVANPVTDGDYDVQIVGAISPCQLAADSTGAVYANTWQNGPLTKYDATQFGSTSPTGTTFATSSTAVAVDQSTNDVYVDEGTQISQYDASGTLLGTSGSGSLSSSAGLVIDAVTENLYASDGAAVTVFGPAITVPGVTTSPATGVDTRTATLRGTVNPQGAATRYQFEYGIDTSYGTSWPAAPADAGSGTGDVPVVAELSELRPQTTYHYRLNAISGGMTFPGSDRTFTTLGPVATMDAVDQITATSATLHGTIDARGLPGATYRFSVVAPTSPYAGATSVVAVPAGSGSVAVTAAIGDLPAGGSYAVGLSVMTPEASGSSRVTTFSTPVPSLAPGPPAVPTTADPFGCAAPHLDPITARVEPGTDLWVTGSDLGVGANASLGERSLQPTSYSATGFAIAIPDEAIGTLGLTINCGAASNTVAVPISTAPDNRFTFTSTTKGTVATVALKVPGPGAISLRGSNFKTVKAHAKKAGSIKVRVTLSAKGRRAVSRHRHGATALNLAVTYTPTGGTPSSSTDVVRFTYKKAAKHQQGGAK